MKTTYLHCSECDEPFEVSTAIAEAMHAWREASSDPFLCVSCTWDEAIAPADGEKTPGVDLT